MPIALTVLCVLLWTLVGVVLFTYLARAVVVGQRLVPAEPGAPGGALAATIAAFTREVVLAAATLVLWPVGLIPIRLFSQRGKGAPILLVPGALMTWSACLPLRWYLKARVLNPVVQISTSPLWGSPDRVAARLADRIRTLAGVSDGGRIHVIAAGDGGLALLHAMGQDPTLPVDRVVTVAVPRVPSRMGRVFLPGGARRYEAIPEPLPRPTRAIRSEGDAVVLPDESLPPDGTDLVTLASDGHLSTWYSPRAWQAALEVLPVERRADVDR